MKIASEIKEMQAVVTPSKNDQPKKVDQKVAPKRVAASEHDTKKSEEEGLHNKQVKDKKSEERVSEIAKALERSFNDQNIRLKVRDPYSTKSGNLEIQVVVRDKVVATIPPRTVLEMAEAHNEKSMQEAMRGRLFSAKK